MRRRRTTGIPVPEEPDVHLTMLAALAACLPDPGPEPSPAPGQTAPDFTLQDAAGQPWNLHAQAGQVVLLDLSAFW